MVPGDQRIGLSGRLAGLGGVKGTGGAPHCHAGFPYSISRVHSGLQEKLFDSGTVRSFFGSQSGLCSESCVFVPKEEGRIPARSGTISAGALDAFSLVPAVIGSDGLYDSWGASGTSVDASV